MENLERIYNKIDFSTILTTGRTGSDYLQACLDNVPGVLTFSGHMRFYSFCDEINFDKLKSKHSSEILELFIKKQSHLFIEDKIENKIINLNIQKFKEHFLKVAGEENLSKQKFLLSVYLAYHLTLERSIKNINIMKYIIQNT